MKTAICVRPTLPALTAQFLEEGRYVRNWSLQTIRTYEQNLARFRESFPTEDVDHLASRTDLQSFIIWMRSKGFTPGGCNVRIRAVNSFLSWAHEQGVTTEHMRLKLLRAERKAITTLSDAEIRRLLTFKPKTDVSSMCQRSRAKAVNTRSLVWGLVDQGGGAVPDVLTGGTEAEELPVVRSGNHGFR